MDYEIGDYRRERRGKPWLIILILLLISIAAVGAWKPAITGFTSAGDELISIPVEAPEEIIAEDEELISIPPEPVEEAPPTKEIAEEIITTAEDDLFRIGSPGADLLPRSIDYSPLGPSTGQVVTINATIWNKGDTAAGSFNVTLYIDNVNQAQNNIASLASGATTITQFNWTSTSALHEIKITADSAGQIAEDDEDNTNLTRMIGIDWPMIGQTTEHLGNSNSSSLLTNNTLWNYSICSDGSDYFYMPSVAYDTVYAGTDGGIIYALDAENGSQTWNYTTGGAVYGVPAVYDDMIYVGSHDNIFYVLNATNGSHIWNYTTLDVIDSSAAVADDVVFFGTSDYFNQGILALNATNGSYIWNSTTSDVVVRSSPAIANSIIYVGDDNGWFYALNQTNGSQIWNYSFGDWIRSSPTVTNDIVYVGSYNDNITALNATNGSFIWNYTTGANIDYSSPTIANDIVYIGSDDYYFYALNATNGSHIWNFTTGSNIGTAGIVAGDVVFFSSWDNNIYAANATNGTSIWNYTDLGYGAAYSLAMANNILYAADYDGNMYAFRVADTTQPSVQFVSPTPDNYTRRTSNSETINVSVVDDFSVDKCIIEWEYENAASFTNYTMTKESTGSSISCSYTNSTLTDGLNYTYRIHVNDTSGNGNVSETRMFTENTKPTITSAAITPDPSEVDDNLTCTAAGGSDGDGDTVSYYYIWYKDDALNLTVDNTTSVTHNITSGNTTLGEVWNCTIIPHDGYENGTETGDTITITDVTLPSSIEFVNPTPNNDTRRTSNSETINVTVTDGVSVDTCLLEWNSVNESMTKVGTGTSVSCNTTKTTTDATNYTYRVHANDSSNNWNVSITRMFRENAKPNITLANITLVEPYATEDLTCEVTGGIDADDDTISYYYEWRKDGVLNITAQNTTLTTNNLTSGNTSEGESWQCTVIPHDGRENGTSLSVTRTIKIISASTSISGGSESGYVPSGAAAPAEIIPESVCGNAVCEGGENQTTCCTDCGCATGFECINNKCQEKEKEPVLKLVYSLPSFQIFWLLLLLILILIILGIGMIYHVSIEREPKFPTWHRLAPRRIPRAIRRYKSLPAPKKFKLIEKEEPAVYAYKSLKPKRAKPKKPRVKPPKAKPTIFVKPIVRRSKLIKPKPRRKVSKKQLYRSLKVVEKEISKLERGKI